MDGFKVLRAFERHDGKALRTYKRGATIPLKEASKIPTPSLTRLIAAGNIYRELSPIVAGANTEEVE